MTETLIRAPENPREHIRQLLEVNERQVVQIKRLEKENAALRTANANFKNALEDES